MNTTSGVGRDMNDNNSIHLEKVNCPKCNSDKSVIVFNGKDYLYKVPGEFFVSECKDCKLWFQNPRPKAAEVGKLYPINYSPHAASNEESINISSAKKKYLRQKFGYDHLINDRDNFFDLKSFSIFNRLKHHHFGVGLIPNYIPNGKLLEIGCGSGGRLLELRKLGWHSLFGVELVPEAVEKAKANGFSVECGQIEDVMPNYDDDYFDVILTSMVFEHFLNPFEVLESITRKLKPGGQLLFSTVVRDSIDSKLYNKYWAGFDFPRHMVYYKKKDLLSALSNSYENIKCFHQNAPVDFKRSSSWRIESGIGSVFDKIIILVVESKLFKVIGLLMAWMSLTTRISVRGTKRTK